MPAKLHGHSAKAKAPLSGRTPKRFARPNDFVGACVVGNRSEVDGRFARILRSGFERLGSTDYAFLGE